MFTLRNNDLTLTLLDPIDDKDRFGTRYCTAGYLFQITDARHGDLLSGPTYPESFNTFDGQGIPDAFNQSPLRDRRNPGPQALILGVGVCDLAADKVLEFARWDKKATPETVEFRTTHEAFGHKVSLLRTVSLRGRTVRSSTTVHNQGETLVPLCWFPHPFFPQPEGPELCKFNLAVTMPVNPGYHVADNGWLHRNGSPITPGPFQALTHDGRAPLAVWQRHDKLGLVGAHCDYVPAAFPVWGNRNTFSWEPYFERGLFAGETASWSIDYLF